MGKDLLRVESPWNNHCEWIVRLQVPSFNGSSYLRYPGLADTSLSWLELAVTLKPTVADGVILYNGHHSDATGDFIALYLSSGHVQFTFDLGTGPASLRWALRRVKSYSNVHVRTLIRIRISFISLEWNFLRKFKLDSTFWLIELISWM